MLPTAMDRFESLSAGAHAIGWCRVVVLCRHSIATASEPSRAILDDPQLLIGHHDVIAVIGPGGQVVVAAAQGVVLRAVDGDVVVATEEMAELDVGVGEVGAAEEGLAVEPGLGDGGGVAGKLSGRPFSDRKRTSARSIAASLPMSRDRSRISRGTTQGHGLRGHAGDRDT